MTVDGVDFFISTPIIFSKKWYSHKFNKAGLRYEFAINIQTGDIVWVYGPFKPGKMNDLNIFRSKLISTLDDGEKVEADK